MLVWGTHLKNLAFANSFSLPSFVDLLASPAEMPLVRMFPARLLPAKSNPDLEVELGVHAPACWCEHAHTCQHVLTPAAHIVVPWRILCGMISMIANHLSHSFHSPLHLASIARLAAPLHLRVGCEPCVRPSDFWPSGFDLVLKYVG